MSTWKREQPTSTAENGACEITNPSRTRLCLPLSDTPDTAGTSRSSPMCTAKPATPQNFLRSPGNRESYRVRQSVSTKLPGRHAGENHCVWEPRKTRQNPLSGCNEQNLKKASPNLEIPCRQLAKPPLSGMLPSLGGTPVKATTSRSGEMADASDSKSDKGKTLCGFESHLRYWMIAN